MAALLDPKNPLLRLGTSSWSCKDWVGKFYEPGIRPVDFIASYAQKLSTVEIDSTFYRIPSTRTVEDWRDKTPKEFVFSAKAPRIITHDKFLVDCETDLRAFLDTMSLLGSRLGPILFQFPYFAKKKGVTFDDFLERLKAFLIALPNSGNRFAVEVRNRTWIRAPLLDLLRARNVTLAFIDHPWMLPPDEIFRHEDVLTGPFVYIRWLGDRRGVEKVTTTWNETVVDRRAGLERWVPYVKELLDRQIPVFGYFNNHYAGCAPDSLELFKELMG